MAARPDEDWAQERYEPALGHQLKVLEFTRTQPDPTAIEVLQELWEAAALKGHAGARLAPSSQWRMKYSPPLSTWTGLEFDDRSWSTEASAEATEAWLRVPFELDAVPRGVPIILIPNRGDYEIYLNGVPARTGPMAASDAATGQKQKQRSSSPLLGERVPGRAGEGAGHVNLQASRD